MRETTIASVASWAFCVGILLTSETSSLVAQTTTVQSTANIFSAGLSTPVAPAGGGAGLLPVLFSVSPGVGYQFRASGTMTCDGFDFSQPDGWPTTPMTINSYSGVSGYLGPAFSLAGVFLTSAPLQAPAPGTLDFRSTGLGINFNSLSPQIGQIFFIGDGQNAAALNQTFYAPAGATRLFLGLPDCYQGSSDPGFYGDNSGSFSVTVTPEPGSAALLLFGFAIVGARRKRSSR